MLVYDVDKYSRYFMDFKSQEVKKSVSEEVF